MRALVALVALGSVLAGCVETPIDEVASPAAVEDVIAALLDPLAQGNLSVASADYDVGATTVGGPDVNHSKYEYDARLRGRVWFPEEPGTYPLLVFLHGQHGICAAGQDEAILTVDDCSDDEGVNTPYPSHLGYEYLATQLASHGYVVASILGFEVNQRNGAEDVGMWARGELLLATLDAFRVRADGMPGEALARADLSRIGLMGHSRGGEGVVTAAHVNLARAEADRHALKAIVALAPTDFNARGVPDIAMLSLVPYCDGDVSTLHGLRTYDHSRLLDNATPKVQVLVRGTNHNFYNSRWYDDVGLPVYPGNDAAFGVASASPACNAPRQAGGWRWTPAETQQESIVHVGGFLRWQVGGEAGLAPFFTGGAELPGAACPVTGCAGVAVVTTKLPQADRLLVVGDAPGEDAAVIEGFDSARPCGEGECAPNLYSSADALDLQWSKPATLTIVLGAGDLSRHDVLAFRIAVDGWDDPTATPVDVEVLLTDATGATASALASEHSTAMERTPDPRASAGGVSVGSSKLALQSVRIPLAELDVDLTQVASVTLTFQGAGRAFLTDVLAQSEPNVV